MMFICPYPVEFLHFLREREQQRLAHFARQRQRDEAGAQRVRRLARLHGAARRDVPPDEKAHRAIQAGLRSGALHHDVAGQFQRLRHESVALCQREPRVAAARAVQEKPLDRFVVDLVQQAAQLAQLQRGFWLLHAAPHRQNAVLDHRVVVLLLFRLLVEPIRPVERLPLRALPRDPGVLLRLLLAFLLLQGQPRLLRFFGLLPLALRLALFRIAGGAAARPAGRRRSPDVRGRFPGLRRRFLLRPRARFLPALRGTGRAVYFRCLLRAFRRPPRGCLRLLLFAFLPLFLLREGASLQLLLQEGLLFLCDRVVPRVHVAPLQGLQVVLHRFRVAVVRVVLQRQKAAHALQQLPAQPLALQLCVQSVEHRVEKQPRLRVLQHLVERVFVRNHFLQEVLG
mmetsp:Transcript_25133/g.63259  ORF Transcript_25133/g.63259 Transcript_25133/m.63259 type:complete len:398 (+) Transcript_25133:3943-5136(+)